ncbi:MAG: hypothetical protein QXW80_03040 [Candidatus Micrarchaeia archaeon]|uniref:hypothetical protein n=1 Tax=Saccharolobus sp. TaxID=2100761 RepID=UPI003181F0B8
MEGESKPITYRILNRELSMFDNVCRVCGRHFRTKDKDMHYCNRCYRTYILGIVDYSSEINTRQDRLRDKTNTPRHSSKQSNTIDIIREIRHSSVDKYYIAK